MSKIISKTKLLATTAICAVMTCANVFALEPTLDSLKAQSTTLSGNYVLTELGENTLPEGATKVKIGNTVYYFTPSGDNADLLKALAGTSAGNLIEDANGVFEFNGTKYGFNVSAIPNSIFSYEPGDETNYHFITQETDDEGNLTTSYHTINLKPEKFSTSQNIKWTSVDESKKDEANVIAVNLPNYDVKYFQYTYTQPTDYTEVKDKLKEISVIDPTESVDEIGGLGFNNPEGTDYGDIEKYVFSNNKVTATLEKNTDDYYGLSVNGGVISNQGTIGDITADFLNNSIKASATDETLVDVAGGAIYNNGLMDIDNTGKIDSIIGNFINNSISSTTGFASGGAIYNNYDSTISSITGDFINNSASGFWYSFGGAIYNNSRIETITGNFINNRAVATLAKTPNKNENNPDYSAFGGAVYNSGRMDSIIGKFIGNKATASNDAYGGAIYNGRSLFGLINDITGDFIGNRVSGGGYAYGGAIYNDHYNVINNITGDFIDNSAYSNGYGGSGGGAIYNETNGIIGNINGNFIDNSAEVGSAIYNRGQIDNITGNFIDNSDEYYGSHIYNTGKISSINGNFINNIGYGDDISNSGTIDYISGNFINNVEYDSSSSIFNSSSIGTIDGYFTGYGEKAIYNRGTIGKIGGHFNNNGKTEHSPYGGAIFNEGIIFSISGDFDNNASNAFDSYGGAIYNSNQIGSIIANFTNNYASGLGGYGGAIYNVGTINSIIADFTNNYASGLEGKGGAIHNTGTIGTLSGDFINNGASGLGHEGGAIYNEGSITLVADGSTDAENIFEQDILFQDNNSPNITGGSNYQAIYNSGTINFESRNLGTYTFYDLIHNSGTINLVSDNSVIDNNVAKFNMYHDITGAGTINVKNPYTFNMINNNANTVSTDSLNIEAETDLDIDVMLLTGISDSFNVNTMTGVDNLTLDKINLVNDMDGIEYEKVIYSNQKLTGNEFTREQSTSKGRYSIVNDGQNLIITKVGESLGFAAFLTDVNDRYPDEIYSFTEDEYMKRVLIGGKDVTGDVVLGKGDITVFGNNHTLSYLSGKKSKAMNLQEGQTAEINDLTIKGFETGLINNGTMTLNNVTLENNNVGIDNKTTGVLTLNNVNLKNNKTAINSSDMLLQGENTISGGDYAMYLAGVATSLSPAYKYPLTGAIADFQLMEDAAEDGLTYSEYLANLSSEASAELGYAVNITNGAEYIEVIVPILKQLDPSLCPSDIECAKLLGNIDITQDQYDELMEVVKTHGKENAGAGYVAIMLTSQHPEIPLSDIMAAFYSEDTTEQEALIDKMISDAITSGDITEAEKDAKTQELTAFITEGQQSLPQADAIYKENGIPSSYEYVTATVEKTPTAAKYPLAGAYMDMMIALQAADENMTYEQFLAKASTEASTELGYPVEITNGAEYIELMAEIAKQAGEVIPESDKEFMASILGANLTDAQYNEIIDVVKEYGEEHPGVGLLTLELMSSYPDIPLKDMMAILYAEDTTTQEALIDELIEKKVASGEIAEDEKDSAKQELTAFITEGQQGVTEADSMYAQLGIPSPYGYVYVETSGAEGLGTTLNFAEGAILNLNSKVSGADVYGLTLAGSDDAVINLNSEIEKADLVLDGPTLKLSDESTNLASVNSFEVKNGTLDMQNEVVRTLVAPNFKISGALKLFVDADLANKQMDTLGEVEVTDEGSISVDGIKIISDSAETETSVEFAEESYKDKVTTTVDNVLSADYEYAVEYDETTGEFKFVRGNKIASEEVAPNQAPALTTTTTVATVETVVAQIFDRDVTISADTNYGADTTDYMETSDGVNVTNDKSVWVKTFGSDDDVKVDNFNGTIDSEAYGVVGGVDSKVFTYDNGVKAAYGIYGAYVGGKQKYDDNKITQDSGYLGVSASFRKSNLFSNFTLNGGYITSKANTAWGKDEFDTKVVSVANKTGVDIKTYNNWTITPALYVAYTGMDTEDYTNKAGVKMENEFSNVITIAPELKASNRIGKDLDGYVKVSYKYYIYDTDVKADDVLLEEMSAKPYLEYGFGVEKNWSDKSGYAEITRRSGGREGWNVNLGLRLNF